MICPEGTALSNSQVKGATLMDETGSKNRSIFFFKKNLHNEAAIQLPREFLNYGCCQVNKGNVMETVAEKNRTEKDKKKPETCLFHLSLITL